MTDSETAVLPNGTISSVLYRWVYDKLQALSFKGDCYSLAQYVESLLEIFGKSCNDDIPKPGEYIRSNLTDFLGSELAQRLSNELETYLVTQSRSKIPRISEDCFHTSDRPRLTATFRQKKHFRPTTSSFCKKQNLHEPYSSKRLKDEGSNNARKIVKSPGEDQFYDSSNVYKNESRQSFRREQPLSRNRSNCVASSGLREREPFSKQQSRTFSRLTAKSPEWLSKAGKHSHGGSDGADSIRPRDNKRFLKVNNHKSYRSYSAERRIAHTKNKTRKVVSWEDERSSDCYEERTRGTKRQRTDAHGNDCKRSRR